MPRVLQRKCKCNICSTEWTDAQTLSKNEAPNSPSCPTCSKEAHIVERNGIEEITQSRKAPGMVGNSLKAGDYVGRMLEEDYGIPPSLINDRAQHGDSYVRNPSNMGKVHYMDNGGGSKEITESFLASARGNGGLGATGVSGVDIVQAGKNTSAIPNPLKHMVQIGTRDK